MIDMSATGGIAPGSAAIGRPVQKNAESVDPFGLTGSNSHLSKVPAKTTAETRQVAVVGAGPVFSKIGALVQSDETPGMIEEDGIDGIGLGVHADTDSAEIRLAGRQAACNLIPGLAKIS